MARSRNIKPGIYKNEDLAECSLLARYTFPGLWMLADREGRLEDRPKRIKGELFPYDNFTSTDIDSCLNELKKWGFINRYEIEGLKIIQIMNFLEHQNPHGKEADSVLPDYEGCIIVHERDGKSGCVTGKYVKNKEFLAAQCKHSTSTVQERPDSLIPDSLIPTSYEVERNFSEIALCENFDEEIQEPEKPKPEKKLSEREILLSHGVTGQVADDFLAVRKRKRAVLTVTAMDSIAAEAAKAGITTYDAVKICAEKAWQGFNSTWDWPGKQKQAANGRFQITREMIYDTNF